ncbi:unnamed protein product [Cyberlindnera jadinii]|uniref:RNA-polymerase II-associated protein 3-like C-terminal domain-containing protein n=1 Tax=Cyberlindnera jadinii (strain ATCC 18201 / CBS 1600 / BCRC 20928 / JCM 3617 / NBRC 0987 / NRRL Y-1542) TaxID=983966 RepID=A0A0H5C237_CYBJN|nr:unnamed protein product [Cyberlindnera jadinii]
MADILKEKGNCAFKEGNYAEADRLYYSAIVLDPKNSVLYSNRAIALVNLSQWETCVQVCDEGLAQEPEVKTKIKLLWRKGTALMKQSRFTDARDCYSQALVLDPANKMVLKSMEELTSAQAEEAQVKRAHSVDEQRSEKKMKTTLEEIPIYEVDRLPDEFCVSKSEASSASDVTSASASRPTSTSTSGLIPKPVIQEVNIDKPSTAPKFPEMPTLQQLTTIIKSPSDDVYYYAFNLPIPLLKRLLSTGCIEPSIINFFLDTITFNVSSNASVNASANERAAQLLITLAQAPRFKLVSMFVNKPKLQSITTHLSSTVQRGQLEQINNLWKY